MVSPPGPPADEHTSLRVVVGTALEQDPGLRGEWEEQLRAAQLDPAVFGGAFGTNVWAGRYEVDRLIGHGGQGATFAATDRKTGARVAIKVLDLRHAKDWKRLELFEREVEVLRSVQHERMPALLDVLDDPATGARALVMSLIPGEDLGTVLRREGPLAEAALWRVLVDVLGVLA
ncbi:MAG: protein kinase domain-containing protein, partial [Myxococcota bacterium]